MAGWIKSAINGASSALGSFITAKYNEAEAEKQRDWNEQMMDKQNAWNLDMWNLTNEYNSPVEQIKRMKEAGLNPLNYGLDGSAANNVQSAQALGYDRAQMHGMENPISSAIDASMKTAQISSIELENDLKRKELGWYDKEHQQKFDFNEATIDEIRTRIDNYNAEILNKGIDYKLKNKELSKKDAEIALEWAKFAGQGLDNELKEKLNPLMVRAQELENEILEERSASEAEKIIAELAETRAHTAALYAEAALKGAEKEGVKLDNAVKQANSKFNTSNAQNKANLLKWTAFEQKKNLEILEKTWKGKIKVQNYYAEHYEEAFRKTWEKSGVEYGVAEQVGQAVGNAAILGVLAAF